MENVVIHYFKEISKIPRCSGNLEKINNYIKSEAIKFGHYFKEDDAYNILVKIKSNNSNQDPIAIQAHTDMVCEKNDSSTHNFQNDPIKVMEKDGHFVADGTTLGADNGSGVAMLLALMSESNNFTHPELELIFTSDEEIALDGAIAFDASECKAKNLINLDGGNEGKFTIGCAGSSIIEIKFSPTYIHTQDNMIVELLFTGLQGGHSAGKIHEDLGNALKLTFFFLNKLQSKMKLKISDISGGDKSNAIPREAKILIVIDNKDLNLLKNEINYFVNEVKVMHNLENNFQIIMSEKNFNGKILDPQSQDKILNMGMGLINGLCKMENYDERVVRTSLNFASLKNSNGKYIFTFKTRSLLEIEKEYLFMHLNAISNLAGANIKITNDYPSWTSSNENKLICHLTKIYKDLYNKVPKLHITHGGLETGILAAKLGNVDAITIGPDADYAHSPKEKLNIESFIRVYNFLKICLEKL
ncbi:beta-Ala-His dipeptidase [Borrelia persica]|uniref:beta-Ala-His dipeptidase n=1 Tax=Borrelia persica TaxID=44448 RepID=UPI00046634AC|nr:beta-Ala-His dipeptidase [Borrelia persica]